MRFLDSLRTAFQLAERVEEVEAQLKEVQFEWGEIEEKLLAREERLRKRLSRELKKELDNPVSTETSGPPILSQAGSHEEKKAIMKKYLQQREG